jgi:hypothetical protein
MSAKVIIKKFGGQSALAVLIEKGQSTVAYWIKTDVIPAKWQPVLLEIANAQGVDLKPEDFIPTIKNEASANKANKDNGLYAIAMPKASTINSKQGQLDLGIQKQIEVDGVGMGVLSDGTPFLTGNGLARLCGIDYTQVQGIATEWKDSVQKPRASKIKSILATHGVERDFPYVAITQRNGIFHAYSDDVCIAILEYYAFDAGINIKDQAQKNYRLLAGKGLRDLIYTQVGYDPTSSVPDAWRQFHDRVSLTYNSVPKGYFGIFKEMADMIVTLGQSGLHIDSSFVPDISVGISWAKYWKSANLAAKHGDRVKYDHNYPDYFKQALSNPQDVNCYPEAALGEFRKWLRESYIGEGKFATYINNKVAQKELPVSFAQLAIAAYSE